MIGAKDLAPNGVDSEGENSRRNMSQQEKFGHVKENPQEKKLSYLKDSEVVGDDGFQSIIPKNVGTYGLQDYLCDNPKLDLSEKEITGKSMLSSLEKVSCKGKQVVIFENSNQDEKWVERDFLSLSESKENSSSKRFIEEEEGESGRKKQKVETLNLSLALPDVSLSLTASNALQNGDLDQPIWSKPSVPSTTTLNSYSNDYTTGSLSCSFTNLFSHNQSCSLTGNSTENFDYSVSKDDQIWNCGEGTNGSVHSRFKPIGDGVGLANHGGGVLNSFMQGNNSQYKVSSDTHSIFPSELPARPRFEAQSEGSRGKNSDNLIGFEGIYGGKIRKVCRPERILRETVSDSILSMALTFQEFTDEVITSIEEYLKNLIEIPEKKEELANLQTRLERRSDLNKETLSKCHKEQLEVLVSIKMGLGSFLSGEFQFAEMIEVFLYTRCRNVNCKSLLPVDACDCKICSGNKGFCSSCMCPVCLNFDCASNTCSWVGCDVCSHWCHAACGIQKNLIKPGPSLKGSSGTSEMQFHCIGCGHASEMFGFVKDVFVCCAKDWGLETLMKELDYVRRIFKGSEDRKGRELHVKTNDMLLRLQTKMVSPLDACNYIVHFFSYKDGMSDFPASGISLKDLTASQTSHTIDTASPSQSNSLIPKYTYDMNYSWSNDLYHKDLKQPSLLSESKNESDFQLGALLRKGEVESLESVVRIKEAEARMFQTKADEARREAEGFQRMIKTKTAQMEDNADKIGKISLHESHEKRRKKLEELKVLENSHFDYYKLKMRMQHEISGLLQRMEATKKHLV